MTVFLLSGIWHGANWTFVVWGIVNGLAICLESLISYEKLNRAVRICITFFAWVMFRSQSVGEALLFYKQLFAGRVTGHITTLLGSFSGFKTKVIEYVINTLGVSDGVSTFFMVYALILLTVCVYAGMLNDTVKWVDQHKPKTTAMILLAVMVALCVISFSDVTVFLYFNF